MQGLAMLVQQVLAEDPFNGALYAFRGRRGNLLKLVWHDGIGLVHADQVPGFTLNPFPFGQIILARWRVGAQQPGRRGGSIGYIV